MSHRRTRKRDRRLQGPIPRKAVRAAINDPTPATGLRKVVGYLGRAQLVLDGSPFRVGPLSIRDPRSGLRADFELRFLVLRGNQIAKLVAHLFPPLNHVLLIFSAFLCFLNQMRICQEWTCHRHHIRISTRNNVFGNLSVIYSVGCD